METNATDDTLVFLEPRKVRQWDDGVWTGVQKLKYSAVAFFWFSIFSVYQTALYFLDNARIAAGMVTLISLRLCWNLVVLDVPGNEVWILVNHWIPEKEKPEESSHGIRNVTAQRAVGSGFHLKLPWEKFLGNVKLNDRIEIEGDPNESYTLADGTTIKLKYLIVVIPLAGGAINYNRADEKDIKYAFRTEAEAFLQGYIGKLTKIEFDEKTIKNIQQAFERRFGGVNFISPKERRLGVWTDTIRVYDIGYPKSVEDAKNFEKILDTVIRIAERMVIASNTDPAQRMLFDDAFTKAAVMWMTAGGQQNRPITVLDLTTALNAKRKN